MSERVIIGSYLIIY